MSTVVSRSIEFKYSNRDSIGTYEDGLGSGYAWGTNFAIFSNKTSNQHYKLNSSSMATLYPNATAHPIKLDLQMRVGTPIALGSYKGYGSFIVDGVQIGEAEQSGTGSTHLTLTGNTNAAVLKSTRSSTIKMGFRISSSGAGKTTCSASDDDPTNITLYFTRYDFSATAGTGVTSASVSSSTGYDGDTVTFSCVIPTGYVFDGWYNGTTLVSSSQSYTHTVSGADLTLTAKAHQNTHNVNGTYNGSTKAILTGVTGDVTVSYNGRSKTLNSSSASHTLACANKAMHGNVSVGSASLATAEKIMRSDLVLNYV